MITNPLSQKLSVHLLNSGGGSRVSDFQDSPGSTENQIYLLTQKVARLSSHLKIHNKDYSSQRGLRKVLGKRKRLLTYLSNKDVEQYEKLLITLGIRGLKKL